MSPSLSSVIEHCVETILHSKKRPLCVGVTGDSGSGKSYFAALIKSSLERDHVSVTLINHDDFLIPRKDREPMKNIYYQDGPFKGKSYWELLENMFRLDEFARVIETLKAGKDASYYPYLRMTDDISEQAVTASPSDIILFDSSMFMDQMDLLIFVDVTEENIIQRKLIRDADIRTPDEIIDMHKSVQGYYWQRSKPQTADIIIDNNDFSRVHTR